MATEIHKSSDLHHKQRPDDTLQELTEKAMGIDPANIINRVIIFLFFKILRNKDIRRWVSGTKTINMLGDTL